MYFLFSSVDVFMKKMVIYELILSNTYMYQIVGQIW